ncbi:MAG: hypothetical protein AB7U79_03140, partial [Candidatus Izemoplasmatales bacterium]
ALENLDPDIFVYGEPWGGGTIGLDYNLQAGKNNLDNMPLIAAFNDSFRNTIKGSPDGSDAGYITNGYNIYDIMKGLKGSIAWDMGVTSSQSVNYVSAHDNLTLYDKLKLVNGSSVYTEEIDYQARLANSIVLLSQGIPFLQSGVDFLRTKGGDSNSYQSSDSVNQLNWVRKSNYVESFEYYKGMIAIRKAFDSFKMVTATDINNNISFLYPDGFGLIGMHLTKNGEDIYVYFNSGASENEITLPSGAWKLLANQQVANVEGIATYAGTYPINKAETLIFVPGNPEDVTTTPARVPVITNTIAAMFEGRDFTVTSSTDIYAYSIDNAPFIYVGATKSLNIGQLSVGVHTIVIKNSAGLSSSPFTLTILQLNSPPVISNAVHSFVEGTDVVITSTSDIYAYSIDDGSFVSVSPSTSVHIGVLSLGTHNIVIKNSAGLTSDPFEITITELPSTPEITNTDTTITVGDAFVLLVSEDVMYYAINDSEFFEITPANEILFDSLSLGTYTFQVKNAAGNVSNIFTLSVEEVVSQTCEENPDQDGCPVEEPKTGCTWFNAISLLSFGLVAVSAFVVVRKKY